MATVPTPRQEEAVELRRRGLTYDEIGDALGISSKRARDLVQKGIRAIPYEAIEEARALELHRLDALYAIASARAIESFDLHAIDRCLAIMARRSQFLGLDAPKRHEVTSFDGDSELDRSIRELLDRMAARGQGGAPVETNGTGQASSAGG